MITLLTLAAFANEPHEPVAPHVSDTVALDPHDLEQPETEQRESRLVEALPEDPMELHTWAEAGYMAVANPSDTAHRGVYLSLARMQVYLHEDGFEAFVQAGADSGDLQLLDARATWRPTHATAIRVGRFKTPVSAEYLIPANHMIFVHRSLHTTLVPRRAMGAEGEGHLRGGGWDLGLQTGVYNPSGYAPVPGTGELLVGRTLIASPWGIQLHLAASSWFHSEDAPAALGEDSPETDHHLDAALLYEHHGWTMVAEAVRAQRLDEEWAHGWVASLAHRFPTAVDDFEIEPAASFEYLVDEEITESVGQVALNFHHADWNLMQTVEWEMIATPHGTYEHRAYLQLQAGL